MDHEWLTLRLTGPRALFTQAHFRANPFSYAAPPPSAIEGLYRTLWSKPEIEWEVDTIELLSPIQYETTMVKATKEEVCRKGAEPTLQTVSYLVDVDYMVTARLVPNPYRTKHSSIGEVIARIRDRRLRSQPLYFGRSEYPATYTLVLPKDRHLHPAPIPVTRDLGSLLYGMIPVDPAVALDADHREPVFFPARLEEGVVRVPYALHEQYRDRRWRARHHAYPDNRAA